MPVSQGDFKDLSIRVTAVDGRLIRIETSLSILKWVVGSLAVLVIGWCSWVTVNVSAIKQRVADGGTHEIVSQLKRANNPQVVAEKMTVLKSQVELATIRGNQPDLAKVRTIATEVDKTIQRFPDVNQAWSAAATLVSYSTNPTSQSEPLPDCHTLGLKPRAISQEELPEVKFEHGAYEMGYLFRNCRLKLSALPGPAIKGHLSNTPQPPPFIPGGEYRVGVPAYAVNVTIVFDDQGISDTDVLYIQAIRCRYDFSVSEKPKLDGTRLLLQALRNPIPGMGQLPV